MSKAGLATLTLTLADETKATASAPLFGDDSFAAYSGLYPGGRGSLSGHVFAGGVAGTPKVLAWDMRWFRPYLTQGGTYTLGWEEGVQLPLRKLSDVLKK